jgi:hypothetical protein
MTVAKLRDARERKRRENGKCEGRKSHAELNPELVVLVPQMRRRRPKGATVVTGDFCRTCDARLQERTGGMRSQQHQFLRCSKRANSTRCAAMHSMWIVSGHARSRLSIEYERIICEVLGRHPLPSRHHFERINLHRCAGGNTGFALWDRPSCDESDDQSANTYSEQSLAHLKSPRWVLT